MAKNNALPILLGLGALLLFGGGGKKADKKPTPRPTRAPPPDVPQVTPGPTTGGMSGYGSITQEQMKRIQEALDSVGYWVGTIDGIYDQILADTIGYFQQDMGAPVTGEPDTATQSLLIDAVNSGWRPPPAPQPPGPPEPGADRPDWSAYDDEGFACSMEMVDAVWEAHAQSGALRLFEQYRQQCRQDPGWMLMLLAEARDPALALELQYLLDEEYAEAPDPLVRPPSDCKLEVAVKSMRPWYGGAYQEEGPYTIAPDDNRRWLKAHEGGDHPGDPHAGFDAESTIKAMAKMAEAVPIAGVTASDVVNKWVEQRRTDLRGDSYHLSEGRRGVDWFDTHTHYVWLKDIDFSLLKSGFTLWVPSRHADDEWTNRDGHHHWVRLKCR